MFKGVTPLARRRFIGDGDRVLRGYFGGSGAPPAQVQAGRFLCAVEALRFAMPSAETSRKPKNARTIGIAKFRWPRLISRDATVAVAGFRHGLRIPYK